MRAQGGDWSIVSTGLWGDGVGLGQGWGFWGDGTPGEGMRGPGAVLGGVGVDGIGLCCAPGLHPALLAAPTLCCLPPQQAAQLGTGGDSPHLLHHGEGLELLPLHHHW